MPTNIFHPTHIQDEEEQHLKNRQFISVSSEKKILSLAFKGQRYIDSRLNVNLGGIKLDNPLMVGAGWDKVGEAVKGLYTLGFAAVEVGSVMAYPQLGNPKPRHFVNEPGVMLNRYGFNSPGVDVIAQNLLQYRHSGIPIGISIGKNKDIELDRTAEVYALVAEKLYHDGSYFVINVSSPNTPGLRKLQDKEPLIQIVKAVNEMFDKKGQRKPLYIKIAPDMTFDAIDDVLEVIRDHHLSGIIAANTTNNSDIKSGYGWEEEMGGVSGNDVQFRKMVTDIILHIYKQVKNSIQIVAVGGIQDTETALEKIKAGAKALQIVTAIQFVGPELPGKINSGLVEYMEKEGVKNIEELVGVDVK